MIKNRFSFLVFRLMQVYMGNGERKTENDFPLPLTSPFYEKFIFTCFLIASLHLSAQRADTTLLDQFRVRYIRNEATYYRVEQIAGSLKMIREYQYRTQKLLFDGT